MALRIEVVEPASRAIEENIRQKHGLEWSEVEEVFLQGPFVTKAEIDQYDEQRYIALGPTSSGRMTLVVFVLMGTTARVITARSATDRERRRYHKR